MAVNLWSKEELILAFNLYLKLPFGKMHSRTPEVIHLAGLIGRSSSESERLNPENGICLSNLYDKAFDKGLIGITEQFSVIIAKDLKKNSNKAYYQKYFALLENEKIALPKRYLPRKEFLQHHLDTIFSKRNG